MKEDLAEKQKVRFSWFGTTARLLYRLIWKAATLARGSGRRFAEALTTEKTKTGATVIKDAVTVLSLVLAGLWALNKGDLLLARIALQPKVNLEISSNAIRIHPRSYLVDVAVKMENVSAVVADLDAVTLEMTQVLPLPENIQDRLDEGRPLLLANTDYVDWEKLPVQQSRRRVILNPGEVDYEHYDVEVPASTQVVRLVAFVPQAGKKIGWRAVAYTHLNPQNEIVTPP